MHLDNIVVSSQKRNGKTDFSPPTRKIKADTLKQNDKLKFYSLVLHRTKVNPFTIPQHLVYSALVRSPLNYVDLATRTGLDRGTTVPLAVKSLEEMGLAEFTEKGWIGKEPPKDWFYESGDKERWIDRVTYFSVFQQEHPILTVNENVLFCRILDYPDRLPAYYLTTLGGAKKSLYRAMQTLIERGLIRRYGKGLVVPQEIPDYWAAQEGEAVFRYFPVKMEKFLVTDDLKTYARPRIDEFIAAMLERGFGTPEGWNRVFAEIAPEKLSVTSLDSLVRQLPKITSYYSANAKSWKYVSSGLSKIIDELRKAEVNKFEMFWTFDPATLGYGT